MKPIQRAIELVRTGQTEEALAAYEHLIQDAKSAEAALGHRAWLLKSLGRYEESLLDYEQLLELCPDDREAARQRADTLRRLNRTSEAISLLLDLLHADPLDVRASRLLIESQETAGAVEVPAAPALPTGPPPPVRPLNAVIDALERDPRSYPGSSFPEVGRMLYSLVRCLRPAHVVETGAYIGYSTLCMAQALEDNGGGHLHSFDLFPENQPYDSPVAGPCADTLQAARTHVERSGLAGRVTLHRGDSAAGITRVMGGSAEPHPIDLAFIDGDHTISGCLKDFHAVDPLLKPGGVILLHDTVPERCNWAGPRQLLERLPERSRGAYQCVNLPSPEGFGLGILQKAGGAVVGRWRPSVGDLLAERFLYSKG